MARIYIKTFGCSLNMSDSESMKGLLSKAKFEIVESPKDADLVIINTCAVKSPSEANFFKYYQSIKSLGKPVIIAGCIPQIYPQKLKGNSMVGTTQIGGIVQVVEETLNGHTVALLVKENNPKLGFPKVRFNSKIAIIPICSGCKGHPCAYCIVKSARGDLISYEPGSIIHEVNKALKEGAKEIWLTAQDTGCYGLDIRTNLANLLKEITSIDRDFYIRVGMANPEHILSQIGELTDAYKSEKVFKFLHIPVQSGNDEILKSMRRNYTVSDFKEIVKHFRDEFERITIATDIICGFPGETASQFNDSLNLINEIKPDVLNISRFWPRPGTEAADMAEQINGSETKERSRRLSMQFDWITMQNNKSWLGWTGKVLIEEKGKGYSWVGRNLSYKPIVLKEKVNIGDKVNVRIIGYDKHVLLAKKI